MRQVYYPQNEQLKRYIQYISYYYSTSPEPKKYLVFPNPGSAMVLSHNSEFAAQSKNSYLSKESPGKCINTLHINRIDPVKIIETGIQEKTTIVFNPLGLNHFIKIALSELINNGDATYIPLERSEQFKDFSHQVYSLPSIPERILFIENYFSGKFINTSFSFIEEAIDLLSDMDNACSIAEICNRIGTSQRNLSRLFNKHICLSPVEFRNIYQFRYSLQKKIKTPGKISLKDIGYESNYNDPSYMIRMYKKYTGINPSAFFDKINIEGEGKYIFLSL